MTRKAILVTVLVVVGFYDIVFRHASGPDGAGRERPEPSRGDRNPLKKKPQTLVVSPKDELTVLMGDNTVHVLGPLERLDNGTGALVLRRLLPENLHGVRRVVIEVGTNTRPELRHSLNNGHTFFIPFEPMPPTFRVMSKDLKKEKPNHWGNVLPVPAAIAPEPGHLTLYESENPACSSLLPMSTKAKDVFDIMGNRRQKVVDIVSGCTKNATVHMVPVFPLSQILAFIPRKVPIDIIMIDAQGFDLAVVKTMGEERHRVGHVILECQNLSPGNAKLLTVGAKTCGEQYNCVARKWGWKMRFCWWNFRALKELNCLYSNPLREENQSLLTPPLTMNVLVGHKLDYADVKLRFKTKAAEC